MLQACITNCNRKKACYCPILNCNGGKKLSGIFRKEKKTAHGRNRTHADSVCCWLILLSVMMLLHLAIWPICNDFSKGLLIKASHACAMWFTSRERARRALQGHKCTKRRRQQDGTCRTRFFTLFQVAFSPPIAFSGSLEGSVIEMKSTVPAPNTTVSLKA